MKNTIYSQPDTCNNSTILNHTNSEKFDGCFILFTHSNKDTNSKKSIFIFYNNITSTISNWNLYKGTSIYKHFNQFVENTLSDLNKLLPKSEKEFNIFAPKNFISRHNLNTARKHLNTTITPFTEYDSKPRIISIIKARIKILTIDNLNDDDMVKFINSLTNPSVWIGDNNKPQSPNFPRNARFYSTKPTSEQSFKKLTRITNTKDGWKIFSRSPTSIGMLGQLSTLISAFWDVVITPEYNKNPNTRVAAQLLGQFQDKTFRSLSYVDIITFKDRESWFETLSEYIETIQEKYKAESFYLLSIRYKVLDGEGEGKIYTPTMQRKHSQPGHKTKISGLKIPTTMDLTMWGKISSKKNRITTILLDDGVYAEVLVNSRGSHHTINLFRKKSGGDVRVLSLEDKSLGSLADKTHFERTYNNISLVYKDGREELRVEKIETKFIETINPHKPSNNKILTMDLETRNIDGILKPICISTTDGVKTSSLWIENFASPEDMLTQAFKNIFIRRYYGFKLYLHNFSYFDGVFILKVLANMKDINITQPVLRDGKILKLPIAFDKPKNATKTKSGATYKGRITIMDSLLILPASLDKLSKVFSVDTVKGMFPLKFLDHKDLDLSYVGRVPDMKYFYHPNPVTQVASYNKFCNDYDKYKARYPADGWVLKDELIKYCEKDVKSLYGVVLKYTQEIHGKFKIDVLRCPTLTSIALAIFRSKYMRNKVIPKITGSVYNDIRKAFYGGMNDVYTPSACNVHGYDVNSLYPSSMANKPVPSGKITYFKGSLPLSKIFGFIKVDVTAPKTLHKPILPYKCKGPSGTPVTMYPTGTWTGIYFSEEIKNAMKFGYTFQWSEGYLFEKKIIFSEYIKELFAIKASSSPTSPWYTISKLLQNSLYGRFGMSLDMEESKMMDSIIFNQALNDPDNEDVKPLINFITLGDKTLVTTKEKKDDPDLNVSIAVSAAISSWSRIHMTSFISKYGDSLCYIDTDGIKCTEHLDSTEVGPGLGLMKYEGSYTEAVFIGPKVYGGVDENLDMTVKVKGLKSVANLSYWALKGLLYDPVMKISNSKWSRDWSGGRIEIVDTFYALSATDNKRELIRDSCGKIVGTRPHELINGKLVIREPLILYYLSTPLYLSLPLYLRFDLVEELPSVILVSPSLPSIVYCQSLSVVALVLYKSDFSLIVQS